MEHKEYIKILKEIEENPKKFSKEYVKDFLNKFNKHIDRKCAHLLK